MKKYKEKKEEINDNPVESDDGFQSFEDQCEDEQFTKNYKQKIASKDSKKQTIDFYQQNTQNDAKKAQIDNKQKKNNSQIEEDPWAIDVDSEFNPKIIQRNQTIMSEEKKSLKQRNKQEENEGVVIRDADTHKRTARGGHGNRQFQYGDREERKHSQDLHEGKQQTKKDFKQKDDGQKLFQNRGKYEEDEHNQPNKKKHTKQFTDK